MLLLSYLSLLLAFVSALSLGYSSEDVAERQHVFHVSDLTALFHFVALVFSTRQRGFTKSAQFQMTTRHPTHIQISPPSAPASVSFSDPICSIFSHVSTENIFGRDAMCGYRRVLKTSVYRQQCSVQLIDRKLTIPYDESPSTDAHVVVMSSIPSSLKALLAPLQSSPPLLQSSMVNPSIIIPQPPTSPKPHPLKLQSISQTNSDLLHSRLSNPLFTVLRSSGSRNSTAGLIANVQRTTPAWRTNLVVSPDEAMTGGAGSTESAVFCKWASCFFDLAGSSPINSPIYLGLDLTQVYLSCNGCFSTYQKQLSTHHSFRRVKR